MTRTEARLVQVEEIVGLKMLGDHLFYMPLHRVTAGRKDGDRLAVGEIGLATTLVERVD